MVVHHVAWCMAWRQVWFEARHPAEAAVRALFQGRDEPLGDQGLGPLAARVGESAFQVGDLDRVCSETRSSLIGAPSAYDAFRDLARITQRPMAATTTGHHRLKKAMMSPTPVSAPTRRRTTPEARAQWPSP